MPDDATTPPSGDRPTADESVLAMLAPVSHAIFRVARLHKTLAGQLLREIGLYPNQELVMMRLWTDGPQRQVDLVRMLESEAPTMTRTIHRLENAGLVRTSRSSVDKRAVIVEATMDSRAIRRDVERAWAALEAQTAGSLSPGRRDAVLVALATLEATLRDAESSSAATIGPAQADPDQR